MATLTLTLCETCGKHGRYVGAPDQIPVEVCSKRVAYEYLDAAVWYGLVGNEGPGVIMRTIAHSGMADVEVPEDVDTQTGDETWADEKLREYVTAWNETAGSVGAPDQFAQSDFHAFVDILEATASTFRNEPRLSF